MILVTGKGMYDTLNPCVILAIIIFSWLCVCMNNIIIMVQPFLCSFYKYKHCLKQFSIILSANNYQRISGTISLRSKTSSNHLRKVSIPEQNKENIDHFSHFCGLFVQTDPFCLPISIGIAPCWLLKYDSCNDSNVRDQISTSTLILCVINIIYLFINLIYSLLRFVYSPLRFVCLASQICLLAS